MEDINDRTQLVIGIENLEKVKKSRICICGVGGVGSYVVEALVRSGVGNILVIDKDIVDITNINRQIIATISTVGMDKVEVCKERCKSINPNVNVVAIKENISFDNISKLVNTFSPEYIVDCVDNIEAKISIIKYSKEKNINCISCMGMGNKINPLDIKVADIYKTEMCPLAKIMRKKLKDEGIKKQKVVYSIENPVKTADGRLGSVSFVPSVAGLIMASEIIKDIIK